MVLQVKGSCVAIAELLSQVQKDRCFESNGLLEEVFANAVNSRAHIVATTTKYYLPGTLHLATTAANF
jgi:hypothetical protein